jgi:hypothetical protein
MSIVLLYVHVHAAFHIHDTDAASFFVLTWSATVTSKRYCQYVAEKCFASRRMGDGQIFTTFAATLA